MNRIPLAMATLATSVTPSLQAASADSSLWSMITQGGWAMYPLALTSLGLIYLAVHCYLETRPKEFGNEAFLERIKALCHSGQIEQAIDAARKESHALGRVIANGLQKAQASPNREAVEPYENEVFESLEIEENAIAQWIHYLSVVANVAPMIGLLGTVSGMIGGFQTMSAGGMGRPELFAGDIGEALITTATGLCIGIPAMIAHSYFNNRLNSQITETGRNASQVSDCLIADRQTLV